MLNAFISGLSPVSLTSNKGNPDMPEITPSVTLQKKKRKKVLFNMGKLSSPYVSFRTKCAVGKMVYVNVVKGVKCIIQRLEVEKRFVHLHFSCYKVSFVKPHFCVLSADKVIISDSKIEANFCALSKLYVIISSEICSKSLC